MIFAARHERSLPADLSARLDSGSPVLKIESVSNFVNRDPEELSTSSVWHVKPECLPIRPCDYPLERTHREISGEDVNVITRRITIALKELSVQSEYDCVLAKVKCVTKDMVRFRIRLYAIGEHDCSIIVELQRRFGSASSFMRHSRSILDAAEGKPALSRVYRKSSLEMPVPVHKLECLKAAYRPSGELEARAALGNVRMMLRPPSSDRQILALENLGFLTSTQSTADNMALIVSKFIIMDERNVNSSEEPLHLIQEALCSSTSDGSTLELQVRRSLALTVLANALALCSQDGCLEEAIREQPWFEEILLPALLESLKLVEHGSNEANLAAACLASLLSSSPTIRQILKREGYISLLERAHRFGCDKHDVLANMTRKCLSLLELG